MDDSQLTLDFNRSRATVKEMAFEFIARWPMKFRHDFAPWLAENWHIWLAFEREANRVWMMGRHHYAARRIIEWLRHETALREVEPSEFKINDHFTPDLARLYLTFYPERAGFFELRQADSDVRVA